MDMSNMSIPIPMRIQQAHGVGMQMNMMDQASSSSSSASSAASADFLHRGGSKPLGMDSPHPPKYDTFSSLGVNVSVSAWNPSSATGGK